MTEYETKKMYPILNADGVKGGAALLISALFGSHLYTAPDIITGAVAGSMIFVTFANDFSVCVRIALFISSLFIGIFSSELTATLLALGIERVAGMTVNVPLSVGATISSVAAVRLLTFFCVKPNSTISLFDILFKRKE